MKIRYQIVMQSLTNNGGLKVIMPVRYAENSNSCNQFIQESFVVDGVFDLRVVDMDEFGDKIVGIWGCVLAEGAVLVDQVLHAFPV